MAEIMGALSGLLRVVSLAPLCRLATEMVAVNPASVGASGAETRPLAVRFPHSCAARRQPNVVP
jgi:hypothetical protein